MKSLQGAVLEYEVLVEIEDGLDLDSFEYAVIAKGELP